MLYRELDFDRHNLVLAMSEVKNLFRTHFEQGCCYVSKSARGGYEKILAVDFDRIYAIFNYFNVKWRQHKTKIKTIRMLTKTAA